MKIRTAQEIRNLRKRMGLSQAAFAERVGMTRIYIYFLERGERAASKTLNILLNYLEREIEEQKPDKGAKINEERKGKCKATQGDLSPGE